MPQEKGPSTCCSEGFWCILSLQQLHLGGGISHHSGEWCRPLRRNCSLCSWRKVHHSAWGSRWDVWLWPVQMVTEWCPVAELCGLQVSHLASRMSHSAHSPMQTAVPWPVCLSWSQRSCGCILQQPDNVSYRIIIILQDAVSYCIIVIQNCIGGHIQSNLDAIQHLSLLT